MTPKQQRFVQQYLIDLNATQAAIRAGYSERTAHSIGHENLSKPEIIAAVAAAQSEAQDKFERSHGSILQDIEDIGAEARKAGVFAPALKAKELIGRHFGMWPTRMELTGKDGQPIKTESAQTIDFASLDPEARAAIRTALQAAKAK